MSWFVMLRGPTGKPTPAIDDSDPDYEEVAVFETEAEATKAAEQNPLGKAYGFEVYEW